MTDIIVCRTTSPLVCDDPDLNWGDDINEELLSTDAAAQERGRVEIDTSYSNRKNHSIVLHDLTFRQPGYIYGITGFSGTTNGLLSSFQIQVTMNKDSINAQAGIELETENV